MPFYHAKTGKYGRKSTYQVTKQWKEDYEKKKTERAERRQRRKDRKKEEKELALQEHRRHNAEMKEKMKELTRLDNERREAKKRIQENNYAVCALRTHRSLKWWRENENKEILVMRVQGRRFSMVCRCSERRRN